MKMKTSHVKVISAAIAVIFLIAVLQLVGGVISDNTAGPQKADDSFNTLMVRISNAATRHEPGSPEFSSDFIEIVKSTPDIVDIQLELNGMQLYNYPNPQDNDNPAHVMQYNGSTRTLQGRVLTVKVALYASKPFSIYYRARISFLLILAGTIAAVILIMYLRIDRMYPETKQEITIIDETNQAEPVAEEEEAPDAETEEAGEKSSEDLSFVPDEEQNAAGDYSKQVEEEFEHAVEAEAAEAEAVAEPEEVAEPEAVAEQETETEVPEAEAAPNLEDALAETLQTASEDNTEVSICIIKAIGSHGETETITKAVKQALGEASPLFEYNDSLAVILGNTPLDTALEKAETIRQQLENTRWLFGIASRSGRTITARRLITEAEQAAAHADESAPVIAFRVDPEKYRKFLEEQA